MHLELAVPGLLAALPLPRMPALERLAARGRLAHESPRALPRWLADAFALREPPVPAGALTEFGEGHAPGDGFWLRADPMHLDVGAQHATVSTASTLAVTREEADALIAALNAHFGSEFVWQAPRPDCWCVCATPELAVDAETPAEAVPGEASLLPEGRGARRARAFVTEVQMLLHGNAVNQARERRGAPAINSVWLWGAGRLPQRATSAWHSLYADDPLARGLARLAGVRHGAAPADVARWLEQAPREGRHLCILDGRTGPASLEADWFAPLLAALRADRVGMVTLHVPDAGRRWETTRGDLRRFWRRARPLAA